MDLETERAFRSIVVHIGDRVGAKVGVDPREGDDPPRMLLHRGDDALVLDSVVGVRIGFRKPHHHVHAMASILAISSSGRYELDAVVDRAGLIPTCTCWSMTK